MSSTQDLRREQRRLRSHLEDVLAFADSLERLDDAAIANGLDQTIDFVELELGPHAAAEERVFYPTVAELLDQPGMTSGMLYDHHEIRRLAGELGEMRGDSLVGEEAARALSAKLYGIYTLIRAHMNEEEVVYMAVLDAGLTSEEGRALFRRMAGAARAGRQAALVARERRVRQPAG